MITSKLNLVKVSIHLLRISLAQATSQAHLELAAVYRNHGWALAEDLATSGPSQRHYAKLFKLSLDDTYVLGALPVW